jgi:GR25 family glycosyltransferase involved in LPS biosynthesis
MKTRIISVNTDDNDDFDSVQGYGHLSENGKKIRYSLRREKIKTFLEKSKGSIEIFDAVTPNKFVIENDHLVFSDKTMNVLDKSDFYLANILSHYEIWNIDEDTLILEDDIVLDFEKITEIKNLLDPFKKLETSNKILYLQLSTPWHESFFERDYQLEPINEQFGKLKNGDCSGTSALLITKECKKTLLDKIYPLCACDRYFNNLKSMGVVEFYLPLNRNLMFKLDNETSWA